MITIELKTLAGSVAFTWESQKENAIEANKEAVREFLKTQKGKLIEKINLSNMDLDEVDFDNSRFYNSSFDNSRFYNSSFDNSSFDNSRFYNSRFDNSSFYNSRFYNSRFDNSRFDNSSFYNSSFDNSSFDNSRFDNSSFYNSRFDNSRFDNSRFDNSSFDNSSFYNSSFYNSRFDDATVKKIREEGQLPMFDVYKNDFWAKLLKLKKEIPAFKEVLKQGKINGSCYEGECACFCGTFANIMHVNYNKLPGIIADASSPVEQWFTMIEEGMTPDNSEIANLTMEWIVEFEQYLNN